jgi:acyl-CoA reductase-like NAD-dependent aldehyde dehydrogenase
MWKYDLFIDGDSSASDSGREITVIDPATEEIIGVVPEASPADTLRAVAAARRAFDAGPWPWLKPADRGRILKRMAEILDERHPELHELIVAETGATVGGNSIGTADFIQCAGAVAMVHWHGENLASALDWIELGLPTQSAAGFGGSAVVREPAGVVAAITPFNYPFQLNLMKVVPALAAGCTVVLKPHPWTPLDAFEIARAATDAGVPPGVLNVVPGGAEVGDALTGDARVDVVTFTGSTATGRIIMANAATTIKRLKLELGGKSARVVLGDVSEDYAATIGFTDVLAHCGQGCVLQSRLLLPERLRDAYVEGVHNAYAEVKIGDPRDPSVTLGPLIRAQQRDRVEQLVQAGLDAGATLLVGGRRPPGQERGFFYEPTVLMDVDNAMRVAQEEIFGPVLAVITYDGSDEEAIRLANDSIYGLAGGVVARETNRAFNVARQIRTGYITAQGERSTEFVDAGRGDGQGPGWGAYPPAIGAGGAFGGFKQSGIGREWGSHGIAEYTELKSLTWA